MPNKSPQGLRKYQNWNGSRWLYTREQSEWHFDTHRKDTQDYQPICQFDGDWSFSVQKALKRAVNCTWATRNYFQKDSDENKKPMYSASAEEMDLFKVGANPKQELFQRARADDIPIFNHIADYFQMTDVDIKFHNQRPGQTYNLHIDIFAGRKERGNSFKEISADRNPDAMRRFVVMLEDWKHGQTFMLGNQVWHQWKAGDCITWEWKDIPHCSTNMGWEDRPMLQVTGWTTPKTKEIVNNGSFDNKVKV
jgi:hypothetical protein|tara:strand:+ start:215 stop:967 length:753 start_codon:yes stop_codon:yes gene_type:complete